MIGSPETKNRESYRFLYFEMNLRRWNDWEKYKRQRATLKEQWADWENKPRREIWAIEVSEDDYAESWKLRALCDECYIGIAASDG